MARPRRARGVECAARSALGPPALSLGLPPSAGPLELVDMLMRIQQLDPVDPVVVDRADFHENILTGDEVDLYRLPAPLIHPGDGGRYLNTWGTIVTRTPDGDWMNWGIARIMLSGKAEMVGILSPQKHLGQMYRMWQARAEDMPFALLLGTEPARSRILWIVI